MLTCPNALWKAGLVGGGLFAGLTMIWALFSTFVMNVLVRSIAVVSVNYLRGQLFN